MWTCYLFLCNVFILYLLFQFNKQFFFFAFFLSFFLPFPLPRSPPPPAHLFPHPQVLKLYEVFEDEEYFYLVTELVSGKELFDKVRASYCLVARFILSSF